MNFIKNLFGGSGNSNASGDRGVYFYVQPKRCEEIVKIRIDPMNDLSARDDSDGYVVRKMVSATRCPFQAEITVYFDKSRNAQSVSVENGADVTEAEFEAWQASRSS